MADFENVKPRDLFGAVDLDGSGYIDREELAAVCDLDAHDLAEVFDKLDADRDGRISIEEFSENFKKFKSVVTGVKRKKSEHSASFDGEYEDLKDRLGQQFSLLSGQDYVSELFHYLQTSADSPQLLALLESFLFSVVRDVKHYSSENQRLEDALKRTCEKHSEHMDQLDNELEQQMQRMETRIRKEERSKQERANLDIVWQLEAKNKEIQTLSGRIQKLEGRLKKKEPEEQKIKEEVDDKTQEIRFLRSQLTDAQTNLAVLRSELAQLRNDYEEQETQLAAEKRTVMECVQEQESLTRQLQLLHEANKKLHDTNDDLRAALESRKVGDKRSPSPNKRHSISTLYSPTSSMSFQNKSPGNSRSPSRLVEDSTPDVVDGNSAQTTPRSVPLSSSKSASSSRRGSGLLPSQQSCEVDDDALTNENSLMTELMQVQQLSDKTGKLKDTAHLTSDMDTSEQSDTSKDSDKLLRNKNSSRFSSRFGKYFGKLSKGTRNKETGKPNEEGKDAALKKSDVNDTTLRRSDRKVPSLRNSYTKDPSLKQSNTKDSALKKSETRKNKTYMNQIKKRAEGNLQTQDKGPQTVRENKRGRNVSDARSKSRLVAPELDSDSEGKEQNLKRGVSDRRSSNKVVGPNNRLRKNPSVTFSPTVTCTTESRPLHTANKAKSTTHKGAVIPVNARARHVAASETSDTDSTTQELPMNFHRDLEEEDEAYDTLRSSDRRTFTKQLDILQETNKRLCDSNDDLRAALEALTGRRSKSKARRNAEKCQRNPSIHSDYGSISSRSITPNHLQGPKSEDDVADGAEAEVDEADELSGYEPESDVNTMTTDSLPESDSSKPDALSAELEAQFKSVIEEDDEDIDEDDVGDEELAQLVAMAKDHTESEGDTDTETELPVGERGPAVGSDSLSEASSNTPLHTSVVEGNVPERMYKLVLAGDAAVGKSSFILRLCRNRFHSALNSTLGVDFQMKTLVVDDKTVAFQLWDTAGQERFRSIAKSYFRKADGVLLLYDVTCETSFIDVRDWVEAIEDSTTKPIPIMLCGNKIDLRQSYIDEGKTVITAENGERLAKEYGALFIETSSKENRNITEACVELGRLLRKVEDTEVEESNGLKLTEGEQKSKKKVNCCPT